MLALRAEHNFLDQQVAVDDLPSSVRPSVLARTYDEPPRAFSLTRSRYFPTSLA
jgi:hypothetical protein